jgi:ATP-binding cassette subfamily B protein
MMIILPKTRKVFNEVFKKYDAMNESVQENVSAIRVVKAYVREKYET